MPKIGLSLDLEDTYEPAEPIHIRAKPQGDPGSALVVIVENVETDEEVERRPLAAADEGWHAAELGPFEEGAYRVSVVGAGVEPVTDLVTVIAEA